MKLKECLCGALATALLLLAHTASALESGSIRGTVTGASGSAVAGAFVRLVSPQTRLTFLVISKDGGRYDAKDLPVGTYLVQGIGGNFQSNVSAPVTVSSSRATEVDLSLSDRRGPPLLHAWPNQVPLSQMPKGKIVLPPGPGEDLVQSRCQTCHTLNRIVQSRNTHDEWVSFVGAMRDYMVQFHLPPNLTLTDQQADQVAAYLTKSFGPMSLDPNSRLPGTLFTGDARNYRVVTYLMQPAASVPHDVAVDPSGIAWAAKRGGNVLPHGALLRFDPHTLEVTEWYAPPPNGKPVGHAPSGQPFLGNPQIDSHGVLWTQDGSSQRWLSFNTHTLKWTAYPVPAGHIAIGNALAFTPNGVVWSSDERAGIYSFNPKTGEWHFYKSHLPKSGAYGLAVAGDGTVWFAEDAVDHMGHVYPDTGKEEDLQIPLKGRLYPRRMAADGYGNIWVGLWQVGKLMKIDYKTKKMTFFTPPTRVPGLYSVTVDKVHDIIWVSEQQADKIARFDPRTGKWLEFALPNIQSDDRRISIDPTDPNRIFFSGVSADLIGFLEYQPR